MPVTRWAVVLLRSLFLFSAVSALHLLSLFLLFPLSTMFFPLCSGFVEVLVVASWGADSGRSTVILPLLCVFFLLSFPSPFLSPPLFSPQYCLLPPSVFLFFVVQCWCGCDGEWQWLLDEEDDELTMALAVLVRLSPLLYSFLCRSPLVFPLVSSFVFSFSSLLSSFPPSFFIVFLWLL